MRKKPAYAVVLAAGASKRTGGVDKTFALLAGKPVVQYSLELFSSMDEFGGVVAVAARGRESRLSAVCETAGIRKIAAIIPGGIKRQDSAAAGIRYLALQVRGDAPVLIHDAARPLINAGLAKRVLENLESADCVVPVVPVNDTIKRVNDEGLVEATLNRDVLRAAQTPQGFRLSYISQLLERAAAENYYPTDEAALAERYGGHVATVPGDIANIKITYPPDLELAERLLSAREGTRL